ncbi:MAG: DEAD/DEAH box helicase [Candidatus Jacksonbacteria bacterium]|jgi:SNF2 family DNA or RNA helicase|nr:DEAD/DEAH box helicase [Candidatus Jacksonbacteria bacterium]
MKLYKHQKKAIKHILDNDRCALWAECGLGKTLATIEALKKLPKPIIVMAPKRVISHTWVDELALWWADCSYQSITGTPAKRKKALEKKADIYLINFEVVPWLIENHKWEYPTVVIDESTRVKNRATKLFKALRKVASKWERLIELTGTPSPNGLTDLWAQLYLIDRGDRLGRTITAFRTRWFIAGYMNWTYEPRECAQKEIEGKCKDVCLSLTASDYLDLPSMIVNDVLVDMPPKAVAHYKNLKKESTTEVSEDQHITATTAATLVNKLLQCTSGSVYDEGGEVVVLHEEKIKALQDIIDTIGGEPLLIVYQYKHELKQLRRAFKGLVEVRDSIGSIKRWNDGEMPLLAIHPASAGHGLNLQHGGRHIVWTTPSWNLEHYIQTNARLHRNGQKGVVIVYRLLVAGSVDEKVIKKVKGKFSIQKLLIEALKG